MSKLKDIKGIDLEWLYWFFLLGRPRRKIGTLQFLGNLDDYIKAPVFFLSTGRCGTKWFSTLLKKDKDLAVFHNPSPTFARQNKYVYKQFKLNNFSPSLEIKELIREMFLVGRENHLRYTYKTEKRYVETNNYITFFAPIIKELFHDAKFVLLYRDPYGYIKSAYQREYYSSKYEDGKRIFPLTESEIRMWSNFNRVEKIAWLWKTTYNYALEFSKIYEVELYKFNFNLLNKENVIELLKELNVQKISGRYIEKIIPKKINAQKKVIDNVDEIINENRQSIRDICGNTAQLLGIEI